MPEVPKNLITIEEVAKILDCGLTHARNLANSGEIKGAKIARRWRFKRDVVEQYLIDKFK